MKWLFIILAILIFLGLIWFLATSGSRGAKRAERDRQEAATIREKAAERQQQVAQKEADAAQVQADAARSQAEAERLNREAERKQQAAAQAKAESQRARETHQEQLRQADLMDPDVRTDAQGNRLTPEQDVRPQGPSYDAQPQRNADADYQTTLQPRVERESGEPAPVSYSEYPTQMSERERLLQQQRDQEIDLRDNPQGQGGRRLADRIMDRDNPNA